MCVTDVYYLFRYLPIEFKFMGDIIVHIYYGLLIYMNGKENNKIIGLLENTQASLVYYRGMKDSVGEKNNFGRGLLLTASLIAAAEAAGCVKAPVTETAPVNSSEFAVMFDKNHLQDLDAESKSIVESNLENISERCKNEFPTTIDGSEKYIFAKNSKGEIFTWGFCDVKTEDGSTQTVVPFYEIVSPFVKDTNVGEFLTQLSENTYGFEDRNGNEHIIMKKSSDGFLDIYDYEGDVVSRRSVRNDTLGFWHISNVSAESNVDPTITNEETSLPTDVVSAIHDGEIEGTKTPEVTVTPEVTATPEATKDVYEIDMEKLQNFPKSAQEVIDNPEKFQQAPDGVADPQALLDWYYNKFVPIMGDETKLTPNLKISNRVTFSDIINVNIIPEDRQQMMGNPDFFYFKHGDKLYVVPVLTLIDSRGYNYETFALILSDSSVLDSLINNTNKISQINMFASEKDYNTDDQNKMVNGGINGAISETYFRIATAEVFVEK